MKVVIFGILFRITTNIQTYSDELYFIGRDVLEICLMYSLIQYVEKRWLKDILSFCIGLSAYNIVKPLFMNVQNHDYMEYGGFVLGCIIIGINSYIRYAKRHG